jgi:hypothetical protein
MPITLEQIFAFNDMVGRRLGEAPAKNIPEEHSAGSKSQESRNSGTEVCATQEFPSVSHNPNPPAQKHPSNKMAAPVDFQCVLCDKHIAGSFGNDPDPIILESDGLCCDNCDKLYVQKAINGIHSSVMLNKHPQYKKWLNSHIVRNVKALVNKGVKKFTKENFNILDSEVVQTIAELDESIPEGETRQEYLTFRDLLEKSRIESAKSQDTIKRTITEMVCIMCNDIDHICENGGICSEIEMVQRHTDHLRDLFQRLTLLDKATNDLQECAIEIRIRERAEEYRQVEQERLRVEEERLRVEEETRVRLVAQLERETLERQQAVDKSKLKAESKKEQTKNANKTKELKKQAAVERAKEEERIAKLRYAEERRKAEEKRIAKAKKEKEQRLKLSSSSLM